MTGITDYIAEHDSTFRELAEEISKQAPFGRTIGFAQLNQIARGAKGCHIDTALAIKVTGLSIDEIAEPRRRELAKRRAAAKRSATWSAKRSAKRAS